MIQDFRNYKPTPELLAKMEWDRLPANRDGYRLDINQPDIREALDKWRREQKIPLSDPLSDKQRKDFELWYMMQKWRKNNRPV